MQNEKTKKTKWALKFVAVVTVVLFSGVLIFFATKSQNDVMTVTINKAELVVEIATTSQEKTQGLCCRDSLPQNHGMLFVYEKPGTHQFWMKDTRIPLDMYWIDASKKIIHIEHSVQPETYPQTFGPEALSQYILETNAGFARAHNIRVGDMVEFTR